MENKKITKFLVFSFLGLLFLFIIIHAMTYRVTDIPKDMEQIGDVKLNDTKIPEQKTKSELLDELKAEKTKKEMSGDENQYVQPLDLQKLTEEKKDEPNQINHTTTEQTVEIKNNYSVGNAKNTQYAGGAFNYNSEFLNKQKEVTTYKEQEIKNPVQPVPATTKNPFGTIKNGEPNESSPAVASNLKEYYSAQVYGDQKIMANTALIVRNKEEMNYNNISIPKNSIFYGIASFNGNRVMIHVNKVKTTSGEFIVNFSVLDNDRIEGLYYQAPIDEVIENTSENLNTNSSGSGLGYGAIITNATKGAVNATKQLIQKSRSLNLNEGYGIYLIPINQNKK